MKKKIKQNKTKNKPLLTRKYGPALLILLGLLALTLFFITGPRGTLKLYKIKREKAHLQQDILRLEQKKARLDSVRSRLKNDPLYIEKIAREKYNMKKKGEKVYRILRDEK